MREYLLNVSPRRSRRGHQCGKHMTFEVVVDCENKITNRVNCRLSMFWLRVNKVTFYLFNFTIYVDKQTDTKYTWSRNIPFSFVFIIEI